MQFCTAYILCHNKSNVILRDGDCMDSHAGLMNIHSLVLITSIYDITVSFTVLTLVANVEANVRQL